MIFHVNLDHKQPSSILFLHVKDSATEDKYEKLEVESLVWSEEHDVAEYID